MKKNKHGTNRIAWLVFAVIIALLALWGFSAIPGKLQIISIEGSAKPGLHEQD